MARKLSKRKKKDMPESYVPSKGFLKDRKTERILPKSEFLLALEARNQPSVIQLPDNVRQLRR